MACKYIIKGCVTFVLFLLLDVFFFYSIFLKRFMRPFQVLTLIKSILVIFAIVDNMNLSEWNITLHLSCKMFCVCEVIGS